MGRWTDHPAYALADRAGSQMTAYRYVPVVVPTVPAQQMEMFQ